MNNSNLKTLSSEEARENGRKGGIKSGQVRRERKLLREQLITLLETDDTQEQICLALIQKAISGDVRSFEVIIDTIGEKPNDKQIDEAKSPPVALVSFV